MSDNKIDMKGDAPVGSIVAFFGNNAQLEKLGWIECDGRANLKTDFPELFAAIGTAFGQTTEFDFCLPNLRGVFLRTLDDGAGRDPNASDREGSGPYGSGGVGNVIGSIQYEATANAKDKFKIEGDLSVDEYSTHGGCSDSNRIKWIDASVSVLLSGGDAETRPVNVYSTFLIKASPNSEGNSKVGEVPVGAAIPLSYRPNGEDGLVDDFWRYCNGDTYIGVEGSSFSTLYKAIGTANGGAAEEEGNPEKFAVPDLRGLFLRGRAGDRQGNPFDPERDDRLTPRPDLTIEGNKGNEVGSYEDWATAMPKEGSEKFSVSVKSYPYQSDSGFQSGLENAAAHRAEGKTFSMSGGDVETRSVNMAFDWFVRFKNSAGSRRLGAYLPVGTILATGSNIEVSNWRACRGDLLLIEEFPALYARIGTIYGGDGETTFALPDMRGRFIRGAGSKDEVNYPRNRGEVPGSPGELQSSATGKPRTPFRLILNNDPNGNQNNIINYGTGTKLLHKNGNTSLPFIGGDDESRPVNIYVQHIIKVIP